MPRKLCSKPGPLPDLTGLGQAAILAALASFENRPLDEACAAPLLAVDATCGNGYDSRFLLRALARTGMPYSLLAFDVQQAALDAAKAFLADLPTSQQERVFFMLQSHAELDKALCEHCKGPCCPGGRPLLTAVTYNLGFLPRSDKTVVTKAPSTLASLEQAARALTPGGIISVHAYGGHPGGAEELEAVEGWCASLAFDEWCVARYALCNKVRNPECLFLAWKRLL